MLQEQHRPTFQMQQYARAHCTVNPFGSTASSFPGGAPVIASGDNGSSAASLAALSCTVSVVSFTTVTAPAVIRASAPSAVTPFWKCVLKPVIV